MAGSQEAAGIAPLDHGKYRGNVTHQSAWRTFPANFDLTAFSKKVNKEVRLAISAGIMRAGRAELPHTRGCGSML
jgi:hypothetical protein